MSTGEIFLTSAAVILMLYLGININRIYISSVKDAVQVQGEMEVIDYGQSLSELMYSQSTDYDNLPSKYGNLQDVTDPATRLSYVTETGDTLYATINISPEKELMHHVNGRIASITVFVKSHSNYLKKGRFFAAITPMDKN